VGEDSSSQLIDLSIILVCPVGTLHLHLLKKLSAARSFSLHSIIGHCAGRPADIVVAPHVIADGPSTQAGMVAGSVQHAGDHP
jgi:hypothetical protein